MKGIKQTEKCHLFLFHRSNGNLNDTAILNSQFSLLNCSVRGRHGARCAPLRARGLRRGAGCAPLRTHSVGALTERPPAAPPPDHHPRRRGGHWPPARGRNLPDLSLRASDRCHWRGNPFPLAFRLSPALRFMAGWHACRRPDFLIAQKVSKDAPGRGKIPNLSPLPGPE